MEDEGMSQLFLLNDTLSDLLAADGGIGASQTVPQTGQVTGDSTVQQEQYSTPPHPAHNYSDIQTTTSTTDIPTHLLQMDIHSPPSPSPDMNAHTNPPSEKRDTHTLPAPPGKDSGMPTRNFSTPPSTRPLTAGVGVTTHGRVSLSSSVGDQVLRVNDVAALLPRREFKLHGGQISDFGSDMSYSSLCKQIDEGMLEGFTESEVIISNKGHKTWYFQRNVVEQSGEYTVVVPLY